MASNDGQHKRKADVLGRLDSSSTLGRGSLSGWTNCPLCDPKRKKQYALGRGISAHLLAVHTPWKKKERRKQSKKQRQNSEDEQQKDQQEEGWVPTAKEEDKWAQRVAELTAKLEHEYQSKPGVDRGGKPSKSYRESLQPFMQAAADGKPEELQRMIGEAEEKGELARLLLARDRNGSTPEHWAAGGGHLECLKMLLKKRDRLPKVDSAITSDKEVQKKKLRRRDGKTCMHYAARNGQIECIRYLVEQRSDPVDARSGDGTTPLHMACFGASSAVVQYLVKHGADIRAVNEWSCSAAHWLAMSQSKDGEAVCSLSRVLLQAGIPFVAVQKQGHSALHKAAQKLNRHVIEWMAKTKVEGGAGLTKMERQHASKPDNGGHRPSDIWSSAGGDTAFAAWIKHQFES
jgi:hypothetical protein